MQSIDLDPTDPLNKMTVTLTESRTGKVQLITEDTIQSPYYTVEEKLESQSQTLLAGTSPVLFNYGGNAGNGRVLEYVPGEASNDSPLVIISDGKLRGISFGSFAVGTGTFEVFKISSPSDVSIYSFNFTSSKKEIIKPLSVDVTEGDELYVKLTSGSVNKPYVVLYLQTI